MTGNEITVRREFAASVERVFAALTDPDELVQWWGPKGISTSEVEIDLRPGGACRWVMHPDGATAILRGTIVEVDPPHLVAMTNQWDGDDAETMVTFRLLPIERGTRLEIHHRRLPTPPGPGEFADAWERALDSLTGHLTDDTSKEST
ncbi:MAG: SRPBCC domain-containing protein [Ilumatobacter sp.]|uniref:SRPBCC family protein n=1 Tax=Ilumatobacter sp. TaxID=1967498 RepID=UPI00261A38C6|nr:SRPBCC domain-containing protein [Ilumatobacter sp.]MDJ0771354.1 SRPBCC domain-containing protein [Ilumatobacter sp.]